MKILVVHQGYEMYGSDRMLLSTLKSLRITYADSHIEVRIPKPGILSETLMSLKESGMINCISYGCSGVIRKADLKKLNFKFLYHLTFGLFPTFRTCCQYDIIYINSIVILDYLVISCFIKNKFILHVHEIPVGKGMWMFKVLISRSKAKIVAVSNEVKLFFNRNDICVVHNGSEAFDYEIKHIEDKINILILGRLNHQKGQLFFLNSLKELSKELQQQIQVRIVGDVFDSQHFFKDEILNAITINKFEDTVKLYPFIVDPSDHYKWAHVVAIPSTKPESFGLVAIEGMSAGCAILCSYLGGLKEIVIDGQTGWFYQPNISDELTERLRFLIYHKYLILEAGRKGAERYMQCFSIDAYVKRLCENLLED